MNPIHSSRSPILKSFFVVLLISLIPPLTNSSIAAEETVWKAGVSKVKITPDEPMWMSGYASRDKPSEGTRTDLWAKALAIEDAAGKRAVLVTLDLVGIDRATSEAVRQSAQEKLSLDRDQIALCVSHTHTGPVVGENLGTMYFFGRDESAKVQHYTSQLRLKLVRLIEEALQRLEPAKLSWASGHETFGVNRRNNPENQVPALRAAGHLKGPVDYDVPVLRVAATNDTVVAVVFGYACHATVLSDFQWSGDYPGFAQLAVERHHPDAVAMFVAGCGADINPLPRRTPELAISYGERLGSAVDRVLTGIQTPIAPRLSIAYREIPLPFDKLPTRDELTTNSSSSNRYVAAHAKKFLRQLESGESIATSYPYPIGTWRLGDELMLITLGGEVVVDYSLRLKRELGRNIWVAGYSHDVMAYIPSLRVWKEGGYEGATAMTYYGLPTRWAPEVEELIIAEVKRQVNEVK